MLFSQIRGKSGNGIACLLKADRAKDVSRRKFAIFSVDHFGADDVYRNFGAAEHGLSH